MNQEHHTPRPRQTAAADRNRVNRGWKFVLVAFSGAVACGLAAFILDEQPRAVFAGLTVLLIAVAAYCALDILLETRSFDPVEPGEGPSHTPLPQSPITLVHDPGSPPNTSLERTREG